MNRYRMTKAPRSLRSKKIRLDNIALVPASLLPFKDAWQQVANELPTGSVLVYVPTQPEKPKQAALMLAVARTLRAKGLTVRAVRAETFNGEMPHAGRA